MSTSPYEPSSSRPHESVGGSADAVVGPDGSPVETSDEEVEDVERPVTELVEQPAKVMRIGSMIRQLLDEVKAAPLDKASRARLRDVHQTSIKELEDGLAPELVDELERLSLPFGEGTPSDDELRVAQAQLVGWLEGLFHGIQTAIYAQQVAAQSQLQGMRRALPGGAVRGPGGAPGGPGGRADVPPGEGPAHGSGMYL